MKLLVPLKMKVVTSLFFTLVLFLNINAFTLDEELIDKSMEKRAKDLFKIIKCPICSGESLLESQSTIAYDIRKRIREKINDGYTNKKIISELKSFYGDSIVFIPPIKYSTCVLWLIPLINLIIGSFLIRECLIK